jgi:hypothetical protein
LWTDIADALGQHLVSTSSPLTLGAFCGLLAAFAYGITNDPAFLVEHDPMSSKGIVFRLQRSRATIEASSEYKRVRKLLRLGLIVGNYDGRLSEREKLALEAVIANATVSAEERMRLRIYLCEAIETPGRTEGWHSGCLPHPRAFNDVAPANDENSDHGVVSKPFDTGTVSLPFSTRLMSDIFASSVGLIRDADTLFPDLDLRHKALLVELLSRHRWSLGEFDALMARMRLAPATSIARINDWATARLGEPLVMICGDCVTIAGR